MAATTQYVKSPPYNQVTKGALGTENLCLSIRYSVWELVGDGTPVDGTSGTGVGFAGPSSTYRDITGKKLYINTNTKASPTWTVVGSQS